MLGKTRTGHEGRALSIAFFLILSVIGVFFWQRERKNSPLPPEESLTQTDIRDLRFWGAEEVKRRLNVSEKIIFLDLRPREAYLSEHILDSRSLSLTELSSFEPEKGVVYVLVVDPTTDPAFMKNINATFEQKNMQIAFLDGGVEAWKGIGGSTVSMGDPNNPVDQSKVTYITSENAASLIQSNPTLILLDIRSQGDFATGHIPKALNIPLASLESRHKELPLGHEFLVYGKDELTAFQGAVRLFDMHFFGPRVLEGGFGSWQDKKLPVEK